MRVKPLSFLFTLLCTSLLSAPALAHHEVIFGPQSAPMLSADRFLSFQLFSRQTGTETDKTQESTPLVSFGINPIPGIPLGFTVIAPFSTIQPLNGQGAGATGVEDIILGTRYRYDLEGLKTLWNKEGNYIQAMSAVEIPNGVIDHEAFKGPLDAMGALMLSLEYEQFSGLGYAFYRHNGADFSGSKAGDNLFLGGGLAYTPIDAETILSFQLGWSYESYFHDSLGGAADPLSGGRGLLLHPTITYSPGFGLLFFGMLSFPVWQAYENPADQDRFRIGTGLVYNF
ncbi:MAG: hypothetical protein ACAI44_06500 [Candidatus Sericytochromatia bacterium]